MATYTDNTIVTKPSHAPSNLIALKIYQTHTNLTDLDDGFDSEGMILEITELWTPLMDQMKNPIHTMKNRNQLEKLIMNFFRGVKALEISPAVITSLEKTITAKKELLDGVNQSIVSLILASKNPAQDENLKSEIKDLVNDYLISFRKVPILTDVEVD